MSAVVDLRVDIEIGEARAKGPDVRQGMIKHFSFSKRVFDDHQGQSKVRVHRASRLAREGLDARDVPTKNEVVDVMCAFVSFYRLQIGHVAHDRVFVKDTVCTVDVSRNSSNLKSDVNVVHLRKGNLFGEPGAIVFLFAQVVG